MEKEQSIGYDILTGIYNREYFCQQVQKVIQKNIDNSYFIVQMDISHFKIINDLFGKETGDKVLKKIAQLLHEVYKETGIYARLEADHFVLCIPREDFEPQQLIRFLEQQLQQLVPNYEITVHLGIYPVDNIYTSIDLMCDRANLALGLVKDSYIERYAYYGKELRNALLREQQIVSEMNNALEEGQFQFYLQPIYSMASKTPISAEALVRWIHPVEGIISPGEFIPIFEKNGFITKLDFYIWDKVCQYLKKSLQEDKRTIPISVNISRMNLYNPNLANKICSLIKKYELNPNWLKLEITESAYMNNPVQLLETVKKLQEKGFTVLMDDFGSGYSSLNMLMDVPVDILKLDMRFMGGIGESKKAANLLTSVVRMAKWLDIDVLAEGVETKTQIDFLRSIACDKIQGYYYSKPLPITEFTQLLEEKREVEDSEDVDSILEKYDFNAFLDSSALANILFNGVIGGMGIYELENGILEVLRVNDGYYKILGVTPKDVFENTKDAFTHVYNTDRLPLIETCNLSAKTGNIEEVTIKRYDKNGKLLYLELKIRFIGKRGERKMFFFAISDVTERRKNEWDIKRKMQLLKEENKRLRQLLALKWK